MYAATSSVRSDAKLDRSVAKSGDVEGIVDFGTSASGEDDMPATRPRCEESESKLWKAAWSSSDATRDGQLELGSRLRHGRYL